MPSKTEEYLALAQRTANGRTQYWESWTVYLTTASRLYKYRFEDQLMICAQRPDATACADYNIEIILNVPLDEFEEFKRHAASAGRGKSQKNKSQNPQKVGRCTSNAGIVVLDKTAGETISIVPKNAARAILRCQDE